MSRRTRKPDRSEPPPGESGSGVSGRGWRAAIAPAVMFVLVVALYLPSVGNDFIYDDFGLILGQPPPQGPADLLRLFAEREVAESLPYYRPLPRLSVAVQQALHGNTAGGFHFFNAVLIGVAAVVAYALLRLPAFGIGRWPALLAATLLAVHPIASCVVYPISSGRDSLLPAIAIMAAVCAFLRPGPRSYWIGMALFVVALMCKEQAVVVPALFVLGDAMGLGFCTWRRRRRA